MIGVHIDTYHILYLYSRGFEDPKEGQNPERWLYITDVSLILYFRGKYNKNIFYFIF